MICRLHSHNPKSKHLFALIYLGGEHTHIAPTVLKWLEPVKGLETPGAVDVFFSLAGRAVDFQSPCFPWLRAPGMSHFKDQHARRVSKLAELHEALVAEDDGEYLARTGSLVRSKTLRSKKARAAFSVILTADETNGQENDQVSTQKRFWTKSLVKHALENLFKFIGLRFHSYLVSRGRTGSSPRPKSYTAFVRRHSGTGCRCLGVPWTTWKHLTMMWRTEFHLPTFSALFNSHPFFKWCPQNYSTGYPHMLPTSLDLDWA